MYSDSDRERQRRYRNRIKLENSTTGNSAVDPVSYKRDIQVQSAMESRYLATLSNWLDKFERTRHLSEVAWEGMRILVDHLVKSEEVEMIDDVFEARNLLRLKYGILISDENRKGNRYKNNMIHNAVLTERRKELGGIVGYRKKKGDDRFDPVNEVKFVKGVGSVSDKMFEESVGCSREEVVRIFNQKEEEYEKKVRDENTKKFWDEIKKRQEKIDEGSKGKDEISVDVEENVRRMEENDKKLEDM